MNVENALPHGNHTDSEVLKGFQKLKTQSGKQMSLDVFYCKPEQWIGGGDATRQMFLQAYISLVHVFTIVAVTSPTWIIYVGMD